MAIEVAHQPQIVVRKILFYSQIDNAYGLFRETVLTLYSSSGVWLSIKERERETNLTKK